MVTDQTENKALKKSLSNVTTSVEKGDSLANAMKAEGKVFPEILIHMVAAGEVTGNLEVSFERICKQFDKDMKLSKSAIDRVVQKHKDSGESSVDTIKDAQLPDNAA